MTTKFFHSTLMLRFGQIKVAKKKFMVQKTIKFGMLMLII